MLHAIMPAGTAPKAVDIADVATPAPPAPAPTPRLTPTDDVLAPLAARVLEGGPDALDALERLCKALQGPLYRLALRTMGHPEDAADATQEVLLLVVSHLSQFRGDSRLLTWAYTIATRHLLRGRAAQRSLPGRTVSLSDDRSGGIDALASRIEAGLTITAIGDRPDAANDAERALRVRETRLACTQAMLNTLTVEERMAIVLNEVLGADDALAARLCEIEPPTFRKRLSRARAKLRPVLENLCGLANADAPCRCDRIACAKQRAGVAPGPWASLQTDDRVVEATDQLGALRDLGAVFAWAPPPAPPERIWHELKTRMRVFEP
jgi:RNA polymerase sigma factor (sigma-70 family)